MIFGNSTVEAKEINPEFSGEIARYGIISQYDYGVMEQVIRNRLRMSGPYALRDIPEVDGYIAHSDRNRIGEVVWIRPQVGMAEYPVYESFLIVDCCSYQDGSCGWMKRNNILAEVDAETIQRWGDYFDINLYHRAVYGTIID